MFLYASIFEHHENAGAEWFRICEGHEMQYRVYTLEMNSFMVRVRTEQSCVGYMLKFVMCATWVSLSAICSHACRVLKWHLG